MLTENSDVHLNLKGAELFFGLIAREMDRFVLIGYM